MMLRALVRGACALLCAVAFHAVLAFCCGALMCATLKLPELDLTSVELSFSDTPDETLAPMIAQPVQETPPPERLTKPPSPLMPPPMEMPPVGTNERVPKPPEPKPAKLQAETPEPPEPQMESERRKAERTKPQAPQQTATAALSQVAAPSQAKIDAEKPPRPRRAIKPEYPKGARQRGEEGNVTLQLHVTEMGMVDEVKMVASCGFRELDDAAVAAARKASFTPAGRDGKSVPGSVRITLQFRLR